MKSTNKNNIKNFFLKYQNIFFFRVLENGLTGCGSVLDVGCGHSSALGYIKRSFVSEGVDIHKETLELSKKRKLHDRYKVGDIRKLDKLYKRKSFDACIAIDVVEHFEKKDAMKLIKAMENIARKKVIILTPNGFYEQHDFDGNPHQVHKSGWKEKQLRRAGYKVWGLRGLRYLRNDHAGIRFKPWIFWGALTFISEILFYPFPSLSFDLYAEKKVKAK